jgi:L-lysine exporter family protein LysE/ArgO
VAWFAALGWGARLLLPWFRSALAWRLLDAFVAALLLSAALLGLFG